MKAADRACLLACGVITGLGAVVNAFDASGAGQRAAALDTH